MFNSTVADSHSHLGCGVCCLDAAFDHHVVRCLAMARPWPCANRQPHGCRTTHAQSGRSAASSHPRLAWVGCAAEQSKATTQQSTFQTLVVIRHVAGLRHHVDSPPKGCERTTEQRIRHYIPLSRFIISLSTPALPVSNLTPIARARLGVTRLRTQHGLQPGQQTIVPTSMSHSCPILRRRLWARRMPTRLLPSIDTWDRADVPLADGAGGPADVPGL